MNKKTKKSKITETLQDFYNEVIEFDYLPTAMEVNDLINKYRDLLIEKL